MENEIKPKDILKIKEHFGHWPEWNGFQTSDAKELDKKIGNGTFDWVFNIENFADFQKKVLLREDITPQEKEYAARRLLAVEKSRYYEDLICQSQNITPHEHSQMKGVDFYVGDNRIAWDVKNTRLPISKTFNKNIRLNIYNCLASETKPKKEDCDELAKWFYEGQSGAAKGIGRCGYERRLFIITVPINDGKNKDTVDDIDFGNNAKTLHIPPIIDNWDGSGNDISVKCGNGSENVRYRMIFVCKRGTKREVEVYFV